MARHSIHVSEPIEGPATFGRLDRVEVVTNLLLVVTSGEDGQHERRRGGVQILMKPLLIILTMELKQ